MKLDTADGIKEWAESSEVWDYGDDGQEIHCTDTATAERLALATRVLAIVERLADPKNEDTTIQEFRQAEDILAEAAQTEGK